MRGAAHYMYIAAWYSVSSQFNCAISTYPNPSPSPRAHDPHFLLPPSHVRSPLSHLPIYRHPRHTTHRSKARGIASAKPEYFQFHGFGPRCVFCDGDSFYVRLRICGSTARGGQRREGKGRIFHRAGLPIGGMRIVGRWETVVGVGRVVRGDWRCGCRPGH